MRREDCKLSIVVPVYNESAGINDFHKNLLLPGIKKARCKKYEIIYVNDGSKDDSLDKLHLLAKSDKNIKVVSLSRNFGKEIATTAGIHNSTGDATIILDADGQHPPELITDFLSKWELGAQVVIGIRSSNQKEGFIKKVGSYLFYRLFNSVFGAKLIPRSTDFRLIDSEVRDEFTQFTERNRITRGLIDWMGYSQGYISFDSPARLAGEASYKTSALIKLAINSFTSLSLKPLFFFGWIGLVIMIASLVFGLFIIIEQVLMGDPLSLHFSGSVMLGTFTAFLVSLVLISQAIMATYISHIHAQAQARPLFIVNRRDSKNI